MKEKTTKEVSVKKGKKQDVVYTADGRELSVNEFRKMIHEREKGEFISLEQFHKEVDEWYEKNIITRTSDGKKMTHKDDKGIIKSSYNKDYVAKIKKAEKEIQNGHFIEVEDVDNFINEL